MGTKPTLVLQPCAEVSIQIGQAISAIEAVSRMDWELKGSCLNTLQGYLGSLQDQYAKNCSGSKPQPKP
jgi:hypothetical protein